MNKVGAYKEHAVVVLDEEPKLILETLREVGALHQGTVSSYEMPPSVKAEEKGMALQEAEVTQEFHRTRMQVIEALRAIPGFVFNEFDLPRNNGMDVGCGATGFMKHTMLTDQIKHDGWMEIDSNPHAVEANKKLHPDSVILRTSYHHLNKMRLDNSLDMVTGLSSLDATAFLDKAVSQIAASLKPGGWLLHMQDVRPGKGICFQVMERSGMTLPFKIEAADIIDTSGTNFISFNVEGDNVSVVELFRRRMAMALEKTPSLEPVLNNWMVAKRPVASGPSQIYYMNMLLKEPFAKNPTEEAYAVVTLAQKR